MASLDLWLQLEKSFSDVEKLRAAIQTGNRTASARAEGYIYLADEVTSFLMVSKNIGSEIETQTSRLNETFISPTHTRGQSLSDNILLENLGILKSNTDGDLHRLDKGPTFKNDDVFRAQLPNKRIESNNRENRQNQSSFSPEIKKNQESKFSQTDQPSLPERANSMTISSLEKSINGFQLIMDQRFENLSRRTETEEIRVENLESKLKLASAKLNSVGVVREILTELRSSREEVEVAIKE